MPGSQGMHEAPLEVRPAAATPAPRGRQSCGVPVVIAVTDKRTLSRSSQHIHTFCACSLCDRFWVCATWGSATGASTTPDILGACATDVSFSHKPQDSLQTRVRVRVGRCMRKAGRGAHARRSGGRHGAASPAGTWPCGAAPAAAAHAPGPAEAAAAAPAPAPVAQHTRCTSVHDACIIRACQPLGGTLTDMPRSPGSSQRSASCQGDLQASAGKGCTCMRAAGGA